MIANISSLKIVHYVIIIEALSICLVAIIFTVPLEFLITHSEIFLFYIIESSKFNLNILLIE